MLILIAARQAIMAQTFRRISSTEADRSSFSVTSRISKIIFSISLGRIVVGDVQVPFAPSVPRPRSRHTCPVLWRRCSCPKHSRRPLVAGALRWRAGRCANYRQVLALDHLPSEDDIGRVAPELTIAALISIASLPPALVISGSAIYDRTIAVKQVPAADYHTQGKRLALEGVEWNRYKGTLVLALSATCHFCSASVPLYRELSALRGNRPGFNLVAVFPQPLYESARYLNAKGIAVSKVISESLDGIMVSGTPTMFLVGRDGKVKRVWVGFLNDEQKSAALVQIDSFLKG